MRPFQFTVRSVPRVAPGTASEAPAHTPDRAARLAAHAAEAERLGLASSGHAGGREHRPVRCLCGCDRSWPSPVAAAADLGCDTQTVRNHCRGYRPGARMAGHRLEYAD